jgi:hypothetical protein
MTVQPLISATLEGLPEVMRCLVRELGADVSQTYDGNTTLDIAAKRCFSDLVRLLATEFGANIKQVCSDINYGIDDVGTSLSTAAYEGHLPVVHCLVELGAEVEAADSEGYTALLISALGDQYSTMQYLLEEAGANVDHITEAGDTAWSLLIEHSKDDHDEEYDLVARTGLLLVALLSTRDTDMVEEGARLWARLPAYLAHRRAYLYLRCPRISLLPRVLRTLIYTFKGPATTEELWATRLSRAP